MSIVEKSSRPDLEEKRALLAGRLVKAAAAEADLPLSFAQQRLWFLDQLEPDSALYNIGTLVRFRGPLEVPLLERAFQRVIARHESLRTRFVAEDGHPRQVVGSASFQLPEQDLSQLATAEREAEAGRIIRETVTRPFKLSSDLLLRALLLKLGPTEHRLVL